MIQSVFRLVTGLVGLVTLFGCCACGGPDKDAYVRENLDLLAKIPTLPGAKRMAVASESWPVMRDPLPAKVGGYRTAVAYSAPARADAKVIVKFYEDALSRRGWRVKIRQMGSGYTCYARGRESVCVDVAGRSWPHVSVPGSRFTVSVDYRASETRS